MTRPTLHDIAPDPDILLELEPEEFAGVLIQFLNECSEERDGRQFLNRHNFMLTHTFEAYPRGYWKELTRAAMEAWVWLEREGLIAPDPEQSGSHWVFVTRRGRRMRNASDLEAFRRANTLPRTLLHPVIAQKVWSAFVRGEYDTAVFQSFKEVEVALRTAIDAPPTLYGPNLARKR